MKASVHCFLSLILRRCASAFVGLSQKLGSKVCSSSSAISASFLSMSKIPPQGLYSAPYILKLLSIHAAKIRLNFGCGLYTLIFYFKLLNSKALEENETIPILGLCKLRNKLCKMKVCFCKSKTVYLYLVGKVCVSIKTRHKC